MASGQDHFGITLHDGYINNWICHFWMTFLFLTQRRLTDCFVDLDKFYANRKVDVFHGAASESATQNKLDEPPWTLSELKGATWKLKLNKAGCRLVAKFLVQLQDGHDHRMQSWNGQCVQVMCSDCWLMQWTNKCQNHPGTKFSETCDKMG